MSIEEARTALAAANAYLKEPWADTTRFGLALPCIIHAIEALIDAKLSPAPVGEDEAVRDRRAKALSELAEMDADLIFGHAPTPPAKDTEGAGWLGVNDAWQELCEKEDRMSPAEHPDMCLIAGEEFATYLIDAFAAGKKSKVADLEARLAELQRKHDELGEDHLAVENARDGFKRERDEARRALADATKRIEALEAQAKLLLCVDFDRFTEHDELLLDTVLKDTLALLSPASEGKTHG